MFVVPLLVPRTPTPSLPLATPCTPMPITAFDCPLTPGDIDVARASFNPTPPAARLPAASVTPYTPLPEGVEDSPYTPGAAGRASDHAPAHLALRFEVSTQRLWAGAQAGNANAAHARGLPQ